MKYVQNLKRDQQIRQEWERQEELRKQKEKAERIRKEWDRRLNPKTKEDFDLLYAHLESKYLVVCIVNQCPYMYITWVFFCPLLLFFP